MPRTAATTLHVTASAEAVIRALTTVDYEEGTSDPDIVKAVRVREVERAGDRLVLEVERDEYGRTTTGGVNKDKMELSITRREWSLAAKRGTWTYDNPSSSIKMKFSGSVSVLAIQDKTDDCDIKYEFTLQVNVPLIGGIIEGHVLKTVLASTERFPSLIEKIVTKQQK